MDDNEEQELRRHIKDLWTSQGRVHAQLLATMALLQTCMDLLKDDPRFPEALTHFANLRSSQMLYSPVSEPVTAEFQKTLASLTPANVRHLVQDKKN
jgi:hypothetical protein